MMMRSNHYSTSSRAATETGVAPLLTAKTTAVHNHSDCIDENYSGAILLIGRYVPERVRSRSRPHQREGAIEYDLKRQRTSKGKENCSPQESSVSMDIDNAQLRTSESEVGGQGESGACQPGNKSEKLGLRIGWLSSALWLSVFEAKSREG